MKEMEGWNKDRMYKMDIMKKHLKELQDKVKELDDQEYGDQSRGQNQNDTY